MSKVAKKVAVTDEERERLAQGDETLEAPPPPEPPTSEGVKIHLAKYEAQYGTIPPVVRATMFSQHRFDMKTKEEWELLFATEANRRIT